MSRMHGPNQDVSVVAIRSLSCTNAVHMTLPELYKIIYDRLDYIRIDIENDNAFQQHDIKRVPLSELCDIESITQQAMVEVRKKLGLYNDDLDCKPSSAAKTEAGR